jgi:hypothetical protein
VLHLAAMLAATVAAARPVPAQPPGVLPNVKAGGSANVKVLAHIPLGGFFRVGDVELEQEPARPFAYVAQTLDRAGFAVVDFREPEQTRVLYRWSFPDGAARRGLGVVRPRYFKSGGRYYLVLGTQFAAGSRDADLALVVFDVTSLPDTTKIREVARLALPDAPGGVRDLFAYKHSSGANLLFAALHGPGAAVFDLDQLAAGKGAAARVGTVPIPDAPSLAGAAGYNAITVAFQQSDGRDLFYGAGLGGYFVYDVSNPASPALLTSVVGASGVLSGTSISPTPDGRRVVTGTGYQHAPLRLFDLTDGLSGKTQTISRPEGAWLADWRDAVRDHEIRWPYVFVSSYEDGLQVFNMVDPANPQTVGWYYTCMCAHGAGIDPATLERGGTVYSGALGVDVRNSDGLVALSDANTGFWLFRLDGFGGWSGEDWGVPNVSTAQDWDRGPKRRYVP